MNYEIKNVIDSHIELQTDIPTENDVVPYSCIFKYDNFGILTYKSHNLCCTTRILELYNILQNFNIKNTSFLFYTHDYTKDYDDSKKYVLCFAKVRNQSFITIPNNHITNGLLDHLFNQVRLSDIDIKNKIKQSIFVGGANGGFNGPRLKYIFNDLDQNYHKIFVTNYHSVSISDQLKFLYLINIDGNGPCYDRLYWQLSSNSVPIYINRNPEIFQLYDELLKPNYHYLDFTISNFKDNFNSIIDNHNINDISLNGKNFIKEHWGFSAKEKSINVLKYVIHSISEKQNA